MAKQKTDAPAIEYVDIDEIQPHPSNPRHIGAEAKEKLRRLIETFGMVEALVVWQGYVIGGNQRWIVLKEMGWKKVGIIRQDHLTENDALALMVALNNAEAQGEYDEAKLRELLGVLMTEAYDATLTAFSEDAILALTQQDPDSPLVDVDVKPPPERVWVLLGVPVHRYGEVDPLVQRMAALEDVICETTISDK
jgi:ParB-like chromosome segregation protein Spo0J